MLCGQPSSGKSTLAAQLVQLCRQADHEPVVIDESILQMDKSQAYADATAEKNTRAAFKAEVDRRLSRKTLVILDTLNNIKGFRYEIWCIARALGTRSCVLHCNTSVEQCRKWNAARGDGYTAALFDDLAGRFERPDSSSRWDSPLYETWPGDPGAAAALERVRASALGTTDAASMQPAARNMVPTSATAPPQQAATNLLSDIDHAAQSVIGRIVEAQALSGGPAGSLEFGDGAEELVLNEPVPLPELRRHKRSFMKLATQNAFSNLRSSDAAVCMFVAYLRDHLDH
jgi:protein KTI12